MRPLLSVIIPTHSRNEWLGRAIASAVLAGMPGEVEVIVVPNGSDQGWLAVKEFYGSNPRVRWLFMDQANVSAARNYGLAAAQGRYVRFLDDDDYFYGEACRRQLEAALATDADVCSGSIMVVDADDRCLKVKHQPGAKDICVAACGPSRLVQVGAHIFKLELAQQVMWNLERSLAEDVQWFIEVATLRELKWLRIEEPVAAWVQHRRHRLSVGHDPGRETLEYFSMTLLQAAERLSCCDRLTHERRIALADGLWSLLQKGLRYDYAYWRQISVIANEYARGRTPPSRIYRYEVVRHLDPLLIESALIPIRWAYHPLRKILDHFYINRV